MRGARVPAMTSSTGESSFSITNTLVRATFHEHWAKPPYRRVMVSGKKEQSSEPVADTETLTGFAKVNTREEAKSADSSVGAASMSESMMETVFVHRDPKLRLTNRCGIACTISTRKILAAIREAHRPNLSLLRKT